MTIRYRQGTLADSKTVFDIFVRSLTDLGQRMGMPTITGGDDPDVMERLWETRRSLFEHLGHTCEAFWIAERSGTPVGYARSIKRDSVAELTEFFVLPGDQSAGVGRELLARVFVNQTAQARTIIATLDDRALVRYLKLGLRAYFPLKYFWCQPEAREVPTDLLVAPIQDLDAVLEDLNRIDRKIIGHTRPADHRWILTDRQAFVYRRAGEIVGYGYVGSSSGPFALLESADYPAVFAHAERVAYQNGDRFGVEVPLINRAALNYFFENGFRMDSFTALFMSDQPLGNFENYVFFGPPIMM